MEPVTVQRTLRQLQSSSYGGVLGVDPPRLVLALPQEPTPFPHDASLTELRASALPLVREERAPPTAALEAYLRALPAETPPDVVFQWQPHGLTTSAALERAAVLANLATLRTREARELRDSGARRDAFTRAAGLWDAVVEQHSVASPNARWQGVKSGSEAGACPRIATKRYARHQRAVCLALARLAQYARCCAVQQIQNWTITLPIAMAAARDWVSETLLETTPEYTVLSTIFACLTYAHHAAHLLASQEDGRLGHAVYLMRSATNTCSTMLQRLEPAARSTSDTLVRRKRQLEAAAGRRTQRHPVRDSVVADTERKLYDEWDVCAEHLRALYDALHADYEALQADNSRVINDPVVAPTSSLPPPLKDERFHVQPVPPSDLLLLPDASADADSDAARPVSPSLFDGGAGSARIPAPEGAVREVQEAPAPVEPRDRRRAAALGRLPANVQAYVRQTEHLMVTTLATQAPEVVETTVQHEARRFYSTLGVPLPAWMQRYT